MIYLPIESVEQNTGQIEGLPSNPRQWTQTDINRLAKSLEETPELFEARPLIVYPHADKYVILGGNLRYEGAKKNKMQDVPVHILEESLSIDKLKEIVLKDNSHFGDWDMDALANEWDDLPLSDWGVDVAWDAVMLEETTSSERKEVEEDDFDAEKDHIEVRCKRGDIWQLGDHRLMCGDSTNFEDVKKLMGESEADLWLTDPPYNVNYEGKTEERLKIDNDAMSDSDFRTFLTGAYRAADSVLKAGAAFYIWHVDSEGLNFRGAAKDVNWKVRECLIWAKNAMVMGRQDYQWKHEPCLYGWKGGASHNWYSDRKQTTILEFNKPLRNGEHPTMKPLDLFAYLVHNSTKEGDVVLDSFGGSGTTLIVAEQTGRKARLMELDPHYCDVIIARWEKLTGKEAFRCKD